MEVVAFESPAANALAFLVDPSAALRAAERAAARCVGRRRHSIALGRVVTEDEARRLDEQREADARVARASDPEWDDDDLV